MFLTPEYLAIAMEYATDGDMFQLVVRQRGLLEGDARWHFQQLIVAVDYCHRMVRRSRLPRRGCCEPARGILVSLEPFNRSYLAGRKSTRTSQALCFSLNCDTSQGLSEQRTWHLRVIR